MADVFVPLNRFQSVITSLTGENDNVYNTPAGVSTIMLSMQITNKGSEVQPVTITITSNREIPVPQTGSILDNTGSFVSASSLISLNESFIRYEVAAYTSFQNNLQVDPFDFVSATYEAVALNAGRAVANDIANNTTKDTIKVAKSYYDKNGNFEFPTAEYSASINALRYTDSLIQQIIKNESVTGSASISRLYQTSYTQSFDETYSAETGSSELITDLIEVMTNNIEYPVRVDQTPIDLVRNVLIPAGDSLSPVIAGKLVLEELYGLIFSGSTDLTVVLSILESANE
jgi:hypothetical protein